jgi:hypothetical protein
LYDSQDLIPTQPEACSMLAYKLGKSVDIIQIVLADIDFLFANLVE